MTFRVKRTSVWDPNTRPCKEAYSKTTSWRLDSRTVDNPKRLTFGTTGATWYDEGWDHRVNEDNHIERKLPNHDTEWFVDIETLEDLVAFSEYYGDIVLTWSWAVTDTTPRDMRVIEIYDGYRE